MSLPGKLAGSTLFITGASRGIGKAIALRAAQDGANIVIAAKTATPHPKLPGTIYTAAKEVEAAGGQCLPCVVDIREESQLKDAVDQAVQKFGGIDILINNASAINVTGTLDTSMKKYDLMMDVNTRGTYLASKLCLPHLMKGKNPHILNISPPLNMNPRWFADHCAYTIAKYGMSMCVLGMAEELKPQGIAVNALWPRTAIATAAIEMLGGETAMSMSRKPEIMADAAYAILTKAGCELTGKFLIDDEILAQNGVTDMEQYAHVPGGELLPDYFLDEAATFKTQWTGQQSKPKAASDTPEGVFQMAESFFSPEIVKEISATFLFVVAGKYPGSWFMDLKNGSGSVSPTEQDKEADVVMKSDSEDLVSMFTGKVSPTMAFMNGKLKIKGNMAAAMKLEKLMGKMKSKL